MKNIRKVALFLAFAIFIGYVPNIGLVNVQAAATEMKFRSEPMLTVDPNSDNPLYQDVGQPESAMMFEWDTEVLDNGESTKLSYQLGIDQKLFVETKKTGVNPTVMDVNIWLQDDADTKIPYTVNEYLIYSSQEATYTSVSNFFENTTGTGLPAYPYNDDENKEVINTFENWNQASFEIRKNYGYSIKYKDIDLSFILKDDGTFAFYQNKNFQNGVVYNVDFYNSSSNKTITRKFSLGLDLERVDSQPFVDENSAAGSITIDEVAESKYDIESRNLSSLRPTDDVGFEYTIQLPFEYNDTAHNFSDTVKEPSEVVMQFALPTDANYFAMTVQIPANPEGQAPVVTSPPVFKEGGKYEVLNITGNKLTVRVSGLKPGLLLTPTVRYSIEAVDPTTPALVKDENNTAKYAYTFPEYTILNKDGADYVSIKPFVGYAGHYVLYSATATTTSSAVIISGLKYASAFFKENKNTSENILLPLSPVPQSGTKIYDYKIFFNPNERFKNPGSLLDNGLSDMVKIIRSRYFSYEAKDRGTIGFPNNFEITNENQSRMFAPHLPEYLADGGGYYVENFQDLSYTLSWDLGKMASIDNLLNNTTADFTYLVELGDTVETNERKDYLELTFTLDGSGGKDKATCVGVKQANFIGEDNTTTGAPKSPLNSIKDIRLVTSYSTQSNGYVYRIEVDVENVILDKSKEDDYVSLANNLFFQYPNIYFMVVRPTQVVTSTNTLNFDDSNSSVIKSLTLNKDNSVELREPVDVKTSNVVTQFIGDTAQDGTIATKDQVSFQLSYKVQQEAIAEYMNYYFTNYDLAKFGENMNFTNDVYISQNYDLMNKTISTLDKDGRIKNSVELDLSGYDFDANVNEGNIPVVMMRQFKNNTSGSSVVQTVTGEDGIDVLRDSKVLRLSGIPMYEPSFDENGNYTLPLSDITNQLVIDGLDTNTKYYVYVDLNSEYIDRFFGAWKNGKDLNHHSGISALASSTTGSYMQKPSITDEVPTMPDVELIEVGRNNYSITWDRVDMEISDPARYTQEFQYEVLRIRDTKLKDEYLDSRVELKQVFDNQIPSTITDKSAQRLSDDPKTGLGKVMLYDPVANKFVEPGTNMYSEVFDGESIIYDDNTLSANKVYFVYVRTARIITDNQTGNTFTTYSAWDAVSATTVLGDAPIDLKVVYNYAKAYDSQTQIPLSFRAKIPNLDDIGKELTFQVTYKFDGNEWVTPITIDSATLKSSASELDAEGYRTFTFMLSGLKPGKAYSIKVRQANSDGSYTPYSNICQWKTDIDEDEYDKEDELDSYDDLMDDLVDRIIDGSQIELVNNSTDKVVMINGNNLANEISGSKANTILIDTLEKGKKNTFIIPFEAYENANDKKLGWQYSYSDMFFNMSANTIDPAYNTNVIAINKKLKNDSVEDYYMELTFENKTTPTTLQGDQRLTDLVNISGKLRATNENVLDFQQVALKEALEEARNSAAALAKKQAVLAKIATGKVTGEEALKLVDEYVAYVEQLFRASFNTKLTAIKQSKDDESISKLDKNIIMGSNYQNILSKVTAYSVSTSGVALPMSTTRTTNVTTAVVKDFGTYGFGGNAVEIVGTIDNQNGNNNVSQIIATNDLEDTLSESNNKVDTSTTITVSQALVAMGNITGMTEAEVKSTLSSKGVSINRNNESKNLTEDLSAAMLGVLYEVENGVNPDTVTIKDYNFYNKLKSSGISEGYIKHIQVAKEMGLITDVPSSSKSVSVGTFLGILSKI